MQGKKLSLSQVMLPQQANVAGNVHGGEIMKMMDSTAGALAIKYSGGNCVTARVDELQFLLPIFVGALVTCTATLVYVGKSSMEILVEVEAEDLETGGGSQRALSAFFTMVAMGKNGRPRFVKEFIPQTDEEIKLAQEAEKRRTHYRNSK